MNKRVIVMRGHSGSGKSTYHKNNYPGAFVVSADFFHINPQTGAYEWKAENQDKAHAACLRNYTEALLRNEPVVVVDNTNTQIHEIAPYCALARAYGYDLLIVVMTTPVEESAARNAHGVPYATVKAQADRILRTESQIPKWWPQKKVSGLPA